MDDYERLDKWLRAVRGLSKDSAKDVISRLKRVKKLVDFERHQGLGSVLSALDGNKEFGKLSVFVKCQLKRALTLYHEYKS